MVRGGEISNKHRFKNRVRSKSTNGSDDSDEDYVVSDEENEVSAGSEEEEYCSSLDGYASEASDRIVERKVRRKAKKVNRSKKPKRHFGSFKEDVEDDDENEDDDDEDKDYDENEDEDEEITEGKLKARGGFSSVQKNGVKASQKRRRVGHKEEDDEDGDEEFTPSNNEEEEEEEDEEEDEDDDFTADEDESFDEEEPVVKRKKPNRKSRKRVLHKTSARGRKRRKRSTASKKLPVRKKARKACGLRRKVPSGDDEDGDFIYNGLVSREQGEVKKGPKRRRFVVDSDSDFAPSAHDEYEYTISEEEREQVREAKEFCRLKIDLRSSSTPEKARDEAILQIERKSKGRKGKEKVEEEPKPEVTKKVCGICLSEEDKRRVRGTINCCEHYFCFTCISEWAKVESRCPLCKQRFNTISKRARSSAVVDPRMVTIEVPERDQVYQPTEEELRSYLYPYEDVICSECHLGGHDDLMLLCDECDSSAHTFCVGLGREVPEGSWFCRDCKPFDPESPDSPAQAHLSDQRTANNAPTNRASLVVNGTAEGFDLNSVSPQGLAALPSPRNQFGGFQSSVPLAGAGASTVSGRIRLRHQIHHCLSERPDRAEGNFLSSQLDQAREATVQRESAQSFDERFCEIQSPTVRGTDLFPPNLGHPIRGTGQDPNPTTVLSGFVNGVSLWPRLEERDSLLGYEQNLRQSNGGPNNGHERHEVDYHAAKEQLQLMVKAHLKNLSRGSDLAQSKLEEIAKCSTQTILEACELELRNDEVGSVPVSPPPTCDHIELTAVSKPGLMRGCCSSCFDSFVVDVVKKILDAKLSEEQKWLCLGLAL